MSKLGERQAVRVVHIAPENGAASRVEVVPVAPVRHVYEVHLTDDELNRSLQRLAKASRIKPETLIAEAVRAYLGWAD